MRRLRLSTLLIGLNVGLLLLAVIGMAVIAIRFLRQQADDQALARVSQAAASAQSAIVRTGESLHTSAQLLSERPTLLRLVQAGDVEALTVFLTQFQETSQLSSCSVWLDGRLIAGSGLAPTESTVSLVTQQSLSGFHIVSNNDQLLLMADSAIPQQVGSLVIVALELNTAFADQISAEVGLPVLIFDSRQISSANEPLLLQALIANAPQAGRLADPDRYAALWPLDPTAAEQVGILQVELSANEINLSVGQLIQTLLILATSVAVLTSLASLLMGQRLSAPLRTLTQAADQIGQGDLTTPIPASASGFEIGALSLTLEEMRRRLQHLTANLSRQQAESNAILTGIVEGVYTVDRERRIQYLNPQAAALLGVTADSVVGRFCGDVLNPQGEGGLRPCEDQCPIVHARFRVGAKATEHLRLADGRRRTVIISSTLPLNEPEIRKGSGGGETEVRQIQVMRDETEEEATRRLRDAVLANISHEFKTPLSAQLASIELLLDQLPDLTTEQIADLVVSLQRGTLRLTQLIDNLLESVRIEAGRFAIRRRPVALDDVIEQAVELMRPLIDQRQQEVSVELPHPLPVVWGDSARLTQVFVNLLANANKFSLPGSVIRIGGQVQSETVTLWVEDQGPGFQTDVDFVFAPFARSMTEEPEAKGVGLGLWIVKSVVEGHGGRVTAISSERGSRIAIQLPKDKVDENSSR